MEKKAFVAFVGGPWGPAVAKAAGWAGSMGLRRFPPFDGRGKQVEKEEDSVGGTSEQRSSRRPRSPLRHLLYQRTSALRPNYPLWGSVTLGHPNITSLGSPSPLLTWVLPPQTLAHCDFHPRCGMDDKGLSILHEGGLGNQFAEGGVQPPEKTVSSK